jgi:nucleotidyltransferase/DNA polymerase involved in DNA repair
MEEGRMRKIIHIDMDAFYASVEQRDDPTLKGKPVAVGYPAKRGVVAAASYEARGFGVRSAMPSTVAIRKCAELVFVPPRFDVYREVSRQVQAIFKDYTPLVEPLSLDEAYLDVTDNLKSIPTAWETAKQIRARIYKETGLTASAGISCNKFLAKIAALIKAAIDGRLPRGFGVKRLMDLPMDWTDQWSALGLRAPADRGAQSEPFAISLISPAAQSGTQNSASETHFRVRRPRPVVPAE